MPEDSSPRRSSHPVEYLAADDAGPKPGVALCLSGGGYRAMVFHVGVVWRLYEAGWLGKLDRVSSEARNDVAAC
jgi:NTE family protein